MGEARLVLNHATMVLAMQRWLAEQLMMESLEVTLVYQNEEYEFEVFVTGLERKPARKKG